MHRMRVRNRGGTRRGRVHCGKLLRCRSLRSAVNIDDETIRIRQKKGRILGHVVDIQHHASHIRRGLRDPYPLEKAVISHREALSDKIAGKPRAMKIEEDTVRRRDAGGLILHLIAKIDGNPRVRRGRPVPDP